jgi:hypothetical protein
VRLTEGFIRSESKIMTVNGLKGGAYGNYVLLSVKIVIEK